MTPDQLKQRLPAALKNSGGDQAKELATEMGLQIRRKYLLLVKGFRDIAACAGARVPSPLFWTPPINLGVQQHPEFEDLQLPCSASLCVSEYSTTIRGSSFNAVTRFFATTPDGHSTPIGQEEFGARRIDFLGNHAPTFTINPRNTCEDPWDITLETGFRYPLDRTWSLDNYYEIHRCLGDMMIQAANTQNFLVDSMRDPELNPDMAARAGHLTIPSLASVMV